MNILLCSSVATLREALLLLHRDGVVSLIGTAHFSAEGYVPTGCGCSHIDLSKAIGDGLRADFSKADLSKLTIEYLEYLNPYSNIVFSMMDRLDPTDSLSYQGRKLLYHYLICYWINYFEENAVDVVIYGSAPHEVTDYIMFLIARRMGVRCLILNYTRLPGHHFFSAEPGRPDIQENICSEPLPVDLGSLVYGIRQTYADAIPVDTREAIELFENSSNGFLWSICRGIVNFGKRLAYVAAETRRVSLREIRDRISHKIRKNEWISLKERYNEICERKFEAPNRYVYFLLNFQPENTTSPLGGVFVDQYIAIAMLRKVLSREYAIVIKEHPAQLLDFGHYNYIGRDTKYYDRLLSLENVIFAPLSSDHFKLLDNSFCVSCVNGTVGWEAIVRSKKSIVFGEAWYQDAPGVYKVQNEFDCNRALEDIRNCGAVDSEAVLKWLSEFSSSCDKFYVSEEDARLARVAFDFDDNVEKIRNVIARKLVT